MKLKSELNKIEKSYAMARLEHLLNKSTLGDVEYLRQHAQMLVLLHPEATYLQEVWGMIELKYYNMIGNRGN